MEKRYCKKSLYWLLRYARKNGGSWDDCNCEICVNGDNLPDENDADIIVELLEKYKNQQKSDPGNGPADP